MILKVHPSNYRIEGFTEEASYRDLAALAAERGIPFVADVGSGLLDARTPWLDGPPPAWLAGEPAGPPDPRGGRRPGAVLRRQAAGRAPGRASSSARRHRSTEIKAAPDRPGGADRRRRTGGPGGHPRVVRRQAGRPRSRSGRWPRCPPRAWSPVRRPPPPGSAPTPGWSEGRSLPGAGSVPGKGIPGPVVVIADAPADAWAPPAGRPSARS